MVAREILDVEDRLVMDGLPACIGRSAGMLCDDGCFVGSFFQIFGITLIIQLSRIRFYQNDRAVVTGVFVPADLELLTARRILHRHQSPCDIEILIGVVRSVAPAVIPLKAGGCLHLCRLGFDVRMHLDAEVLGIFGIFLIRIIAVFIAVYKNLYGQSRLIINPAEIAVIIGIAAVDGTNLARADIIGDPEHLGLILAVYRIVVGDDIVVGISGIVVLVDKIAAFGIAVVINVSRQTGVDIIAPYSGSAAVLEGILRN